MIYSRIETASVCVRKYMRIMGLDYGSKTVGVALSDELLMTAQPFETIVRNGENKLRKTLARIVEIVEEKNVHLIVLGKPVHLNGTEGERVLRTREFYESLQKRVSIPIVWVDERLTSVEAKDILLDSGIKKEDIKKYIDSVAASLILKDYMNRTE